MFIRGFLQDAVNSLHILFIQMDLEESQCSDELIASAKYDSKSGILHGNCWMLQTLHMCFFANRYCTMNYFSSLEDQTCWVIFIVKVSRISSRSQYIGFQGGEEQKEYGYYHGEVICLQPYPGLKLCFVFCIKRSLALGAH